MKFTPMKMTPEDRKAFSELIGCVIGVGGSLVAAGIAAGVIAAGVSPDTVGIAIVAIFGAAFVIGIVWLFISCHETDVAIMISLCAPYPVVINYSASSDGSGWTHVASGTKGKRAAERVRNAAKVITERSRQYNWNP